MADKRPCVKIIDTNYSLIKETIHLWLVYVFLRQADQFSLERRVKDGQEQKASVRRDSPMYPIRSLHSLTQWCNEIRIDLSSCFSTYQRKIKGAIKYLNT